MGSYAGVIKDALLLFPLVAALFTLPYILFNYRKYGSVRSIRMLVIYSFILYLLCAYCLVVLPLPDKDFFLTPEGRGVQLIPFRFVADVIEHVRESAHTGLMAYIDNRASLICVFNVLLLLPFGVYLHYYFQYSLKKTVLLSFLLSLFFELTQLSGLYFIYPVSYRLFDVDDLLLNTLGSLLGFWAVTPFIKLLPNRQKMDELSYRRGRRVSLFRRLTAICVDGLLMAVVYQLLRLLWRWLGLPHTRILPIIWTVILHTAVLMPRGQSLGKYLTRLKIVRMDGGKPKVYQYLLRGLGLLLAFPGLPLIAQWALGFLGDTPPVLIAKAALMMAYAFYLLFSLLYAALHNPLFYERLSKTKVVSSLE